MSETRSFLMVRYDVLSFLLTVGAFVVAAFLARIFTQSDEFRDLIWIMVAAGFLLFLSYLASPFLPTKPSKEALKKIVGFAGLGFLTVFLIQFAIQMGQNVGYQLTHAALPASEILSPKGLMGIYVSLAAIFEENLRFALLRILDKYRPMLPGFPFVGPLFQYRVFIIFFVTFIWTAYHVQSYFGVTFALWVGLFASGVMMSYFMLWSENVLVAILIHLMWNLMVVL